MPSLSTSPPAGFASGALFHLGRIVLSSLFVLGGIDKVMEPARSITMMEAAGLPFPQMLIWLVIAAELGLGLLIASGTWFVGHRIVFLAALALIGHTALVNLLFHDFWNMEGPIARLELSLFFKNITVIGGLAMVASIYGWRRSKA